MTAKSGTPLIASRSAKRLHDRVDDLAELSRRRAFQSAGLFHLRHGRLDVGRHGLSRQAVLLGRAHGKIVSQLHQVGAAVDLLANALDLRSISR
jgi:hypothetical protein